jgi:glycosyltransferase 2 family protein
MAAMSPRLAFGLKAIVSIALLAYVVAMAQPGAILAALGRADTMGVAVGSALWLVVQVLYVAKWHLLNRVQGLTVGFRALLDTYFVGAFFNAFLPSSFGGDAVRGYRLARQSGQVGASVASVAVDRATSLYALLLLATIATALAPAAWHLAPLGVLAGLDVMGAVAFWAVLRTDALDRLAGWRPIAARPRLQAAVVEMGAAMVAMRRAPGAIALALAISVLYQFLAVVLHVAFMRALDLAVPFGYAAVAVPMLGLAVSVPVSINGLGIREGGFALALGRVGVAPGPAAAVGLLSTAMLLLSAAWGAVLVVHERRSRS